MIDPDWVEVFPDGVDAVVECGACGYRERCAADAAEGLRRVHAAECPEG